VVGPRVGAHCDHSEDDLIKSMQAVQQAVPLTY
jgi:hypothetical protein